MSHCGNVHYTDMGWYNRTGIMRVATAIAQIAQNIAIAQQVEYTTLPLASLCIGPEVRRDSR
ncbi:hypothetical protein Taro_051150 [Colocasia esculenta]|uniref:Uncharacterized protein n=1 Tax=Colocasia esculenta TaxID=4460 RepID=A0A843XFW8_COLES|nr:hypothetical protein [Colocasia esculenta]